MAATLMPKHFWIFTFNGISITQPIAAAATGATAVWSERYLRLMTISQEDNRRAAEAFVSEK